MVYYILHMKMGYWKVYIQLFLMISAQYSIYITKVYLLKLNYFKMKCISQKDSWFVDTGYKNNTSYVTFSGPQHMATMFSFKKLPVNVSLSNV